MSGLYNMNRIMSSIAVRPPEPSSIAFAAKISGIKYAHMYLIQRFAIVCLAHNLASELHAIFVTGPLLLSLRYAEFQVCMYDKKGTQFRNV